MMYLGIDPGAGGGIAILGESGTVIYTTKMPASERDVLDFLERRRHFGNSEGAARAAIEHVWSIPGQGGAFAFGCSVGGLRMALTAARIPFDPVLPKRWQQALGIKYPKGAGDTIKKNISKRRAQQIFPEQTITHAIADALLIAEYCRRVHRLSDGKTEGDPAQGNTEAGGKSERQRQIGKRVERAKASLEARREITAAEARTAKPTSPRYGAGAKQAAG